jgi:hypothetical protein
MIGFAHVILHVGLCTAMARATPETTMPIHVRLVDRHGKQAFDQTFHVERGDDPTAIVEFDSPWGQYAMEVDSPKYGCGVEDRVMIISEHDRAITENLGPPTAEPLLPAMLLLGTAPQSLLYIKPTFVLFDKATTDCNKPITQPLAAHMEVENDQDGYYVSFYPDQPLPAGVTPVLALRLKSTTGLRHYVRVPVPLDYSQRVGWPGVTQFNISEDMVEVLATEPADTLLCPKLWKTSAG